MFAYENGIGIAFLFWLWGTVMLLISINSKFESNLHKIGMRISWVSLSPKLMDEKYLKSSATRKTLKFFFLVFVINLPCILLSWVYVAICVGMIAYSRSKNYGKPQALKEFQWKLRNKDMAFGEIVREMMKAEDKDPSEYESFKESIMSDLLQRGIG